MDIFFGNQLDKLGSARFNLTEDRQEISRRLLFGYTLMLAIDTVSQLSILSESDRVWQWPKPHLLIIDYFYSDGIDRVWWRLAH